MPDLTRREALRGLGISLGARLIPALPLRAATAPDRSVVLTFDDGVSSHATFAGPLLKKYGFPGTFFVCEFPPDFEDKHKYMTWEQIRELHQMGFEIGNHTLTHKHVNRMTPGQFHEELAAVEQKCAAIGIAKPVSFAYPGYDTSPAALSVLKERGYRFARAGLDRPYDPKTDSPLMIPGFTIRGADEPAAIAMVTQAREGRIVVLTLHGIPDYAHDWVSISPSLFEHLLEYLKRENYNVLAVRDLARYL
jgi:peptidoglycan-N-acetylglucosamine deacetylase